MTRVPKYLCATPDGSMLVYVSVVGGAPDGSSEWLRSFRLFVEAGKMMWPVGIVRVWYYGSDGTCIETVMGRSFFFPLLLGADHDSPCCDEMKLVYLDPGDYDIIELSDGLTITKKK